MIKTHFRKWLFSCPAMLLFCFSSTGQIVQKPLNNTEKIYVERIIALANYLRKSKTTKVDFHNTETYSADEVFYDHVIDSFLAKDTMWALFQKNTDVFAPEGKMDIVRYILHSFDVALDSLDSQDIIIEPDRYDPKDNRVPGTAVTHDPNAMNILIKRQGKWERATTCYFDPKSKKLIGFSILGGLTE